MTGQSINRRGLIGNSSEVQFVSRLQTTKLEYTDRINIKREAHVLYSNLNNQLISL